VRRVVHFGAAVDARLVGAAGELPRIADQIVEEDREEARIRMCGLRRRPAMARRKGR
jgi:hypothetical protein